MKKFLSIILCTLIFISSIPVYSFAEDIGESTPQEESEDVTDVQESEDVQFNQNPPNDEIEEANDKIEEVPDLSEEPIEELIEEEGIGVEDTSIEETIESPEIEGPSEELSEASEVSAPFNASRELDGVIITVSAGEGVLPEGSVLSVEKVSETGEKEANKAIEEVREGNLVASYLFDIKILKDGAEIQPNGEVSVTFNLKEITNENLEMKVYHIDSEFNVDELETEEVEGEISVVTEGFSIYTVEFTYNDKEFSLDGDEYIKLYDLLALVGLTGEVESWEVSNPSLFNIYLGTEDEVSYDYEIIDENIYEHPINNPDGDTLYVVPLQMFNTEEWLKVVIEGIEYEIKVTDDNIYQNVPSSYSGNISTNNDDNLAITGDTYFLNAPKPDYVMQSQSTTSATDFAAGLPLSTIFIDVDKIGNAGNIGVQGEFTLLTENEAIRNGFEHYYSTDGSGNNMQLTGDVVMYNPLADTENLMQIEPNKINVLEGDLFQFIYRDAAILPNGNRAHVKIVYSNAKIAVDQRLGVTDTASGLVPSNYQGAIYLARGGTVARGGNDERYLGWRNRTLTQEPNQPFTQAQKQAMVNAVDNTINANWGQSYITNNANSTETPALGQSIDVKYQVVDDDGNPIDGTFIFAVTGVNLDRDPYAVSGNNTAKPLWTYTAEDPDLHFFSEAMSINQGKVSDYIYVRPNTNVFESNELKQKAEASNPPSQKYNYYYAQVIEDSNGNVKFIGNGYNPSNLGGNDESYNAGFVVLANAKDGITVTSTGHATSRLGMNTQAWGGVQIWYRYTSWTGTGGKIQTTSEGNYNGTLNDASDQGVNSNILDAGVYVVPEGKDVTYTMTPNEGFQIRRLRVKNANGSLREIKFNGKALSTMEEGQTYSFNDAAGRRCTLTALADGKFKLVMPYAKHDEEVRVEWERTNAEVKVKKSTVNDIAGTFNFKIKAQKKADVIEYTPDLLGSVWKDPETGTYSMQLTEGITCSIDFEELIARLTSTIYSERLTIEDAEYSWGKTLWKTGSNLSDLGFGIDDDLFVGFANIASSVEEEEIGTALNTGYSAAGPERIYLFNPSTTLHKDVITYWNFNTLEGQETDPGWYSFTVDAGDEKVLTVQRGYAYEVKEENDANWELLDINGNPIESATGILNDEINNPEHEFLNREVPDLTIKKETINDVPGTFEFKVKVWRETERLCVNCGGTGVEDRHFDFHTETEIIDETTRKHTIVIDDISEMIAIERVTPYNLANVDYEKVGDNTYEKNYYNITDTTNLLETVLFQVISKAADMDVVMFELLIDPASDTQETYNRSRECPVCNNGHLDSLKTPMDLSEQFGEPDSDGYYHFTLNNGESLNVPNLPYGAKYEVIEVKQDGWRLTNKENDKGEITNNTTATFTNEKLLSLTIRKETDVDTNEEFGFEVALTCPIINNKLTPVGNHETLRYDGSDSFGSSYIYNEGQPSETYMWVLPEQNIIRLKRPYEEEVILSLSDIDSYHEEDELGDRCHGVVYLDYEGCRYTVVYRTDASYVDEERYFEIKPLLFKYSFSLHSSEEFTIPDIPYGCNYEVYEIDKDGNKVSVGDVFNTKWELRSKTNDSGTLIENTTSVFTNEMKKGSINVKKETKGNEEGEFKFKVKVWEEYTSTTDINVTNYLDLTSYGGTATTEEGVYEFTLNNGENFAIEDIPFGYKYEVYEETPDGWDLVSIDGLTPRDKASGIIASETPYKHTFLNAKKKTLTFGKEVTGNMGDKRKEFEFEVRIFGEKLLFSDEVGQYLPANSWYSGTAGILFAHPELNYGLWEHIDKFESGNLTDLYDIVISDIYCLFNTGLEYRPPGGWDGNSFNNGDVYLEELSGRGVGNIGDDHYSIDYPTPIEGIENTKQGAVFSPDWIDLEEYGGEYVGDGVFKFKLKHDETITIPDIPYGYTYEIKEKEYSEYEQKVDGEIGREVGGTLTEDKEHEFENRLQVAVPTRIRYDSHILGAGLMVLIGFVVIIVIKKRKAS